MVSKARNISDRSLPVADTTTVVGDSDLIDAVLEGGPATISETLRSQAINSLVEKIKIPHYGGYEHFVRIGGREAGDRGHVVFRWMMRTEVAE
jgi:hypothetical protein